MNTSANIRMISEKKKKPKLDLKANEISIQVETAADGCERFLWWRVMCAKAILFVVDLHRLIKY